MSRTFNYTFETSIFQVEKFHFTLLIFHVNDSSYIRIYECTQCDITVAATNKMVHHNYTCHIFLAIYFVQFSRNTVYNFWLWLLEEASIPLSIVQNQFNKARCFFGQFDCDSELEQKLKSGNNSTKITVACLVNSRYNSYLHRSFIQLFRILYTRTYLFARLRSTRHVHVLTHALPPSSIWHLWLGSAHCQLRLSPICSTI